MLLMLRLTGRTHIYLFILASELIYAFSFYIVNLDLSFKVLKSKFRTKFLKCKRVLSLNSVNFRLF